MNFDDYDLAAGASDKIPARLDQDSRLAFLVLGLVDEVGEVAGSLKKYMRNDISPKNRKADIVSRLGDALWYISRMSHNLDSSLEEVALRNIDLLRRRWLETGGTLFSPDRELFSEDNEKFPDVIDFNFSKIVVDGITKMKFSTSVHGPIGPLIDDNERVDDGYRFHDVIHIAMLMILHWSPVMRMLLKVKRKSSPTMDRVEDGAKARAIEEAMARIIYIYIEDNDFLASATSVGTKFLSSLCEFDRTREVSWTTESQWERLIMKSAEILRQLLAHEEGTVTVDLKAQKMEFIPSLP